jgi:hypothetical protein
LGNVSNIKKYFERKDAITPLGGRKVTMPEFKALDEEDRAELGALAAVELETDEGEES